MNDSHELIAAFADGEPVPATALKAALGDEDGRDYLIDLLALRGLVNDAKPVAAQPAPSRPAAARTTTRVSTWRLLSAAALIVISVTGGYAAGRITAERAGEARVVAAVPDQVTAPAPTHVIRMENGINWNERAGGN
jgi:hypothetical protein